MRINEMEIRGKDQPLLAKENDPATGEIQKAVEQAMIRETIAAGANFIEEVGENVKTSQTEASNAPKEETREPEKSTDRAAISEEGDPYRDRRYGNEELDRIREEEKLKEALKALKDWMPSFNKMVEDEINDLTAMYQELLRSILEHSPAGSREAQISTLDEKLSELLLKLLNSRLGELKALLDTYGSPEAKEAVRKALYYNVTGKAIDRKELLIIFKDLLNADMVLKEGKESLSTSQKYLQGQERQGMIYQPDGSGRIKNEPGYAGQMAKEAYLPQPHWTKEMALEVKSASGAQVSISPMAEKIVYTIQDLALAERFAEYINHSGNLFSAAVLSGSSEELHGFLAALMTIKTQVYCIRSGMDKGLAFELREAVDRLIDFYIQEEYRRSSENGRQSQGQKPFFQPKDAYKIFYYIMGLYHTNGDLSESLNKGIRQAYRQFLKKQEGIKASEETLCFFSGEKKDTIEDWKTGKRYVEHDFKEFTALLNESGENMLPIGVLELSPWGMFLEPESSDKKEKGLASTHLIWGLGLILFVFILSLIISIR